MSDFPRPEIKSENYEFGRLYVMANGDLIFFRDPKINSRFCTFKFIKNTDSRGRAKEMYDENSTLEIQKTENLKLATDSDILSFGENIREAIGFDGLDQAEQDRIGMLFSEKQKTE